jgi:membrane-bound lytic murein transglycosylase F
LKKGIKVTLVFAVLVFSLFFGRNALRFLFDEKELEPRQCNLEKILSEKELKVVLDYNTTNYFVYRGEPKGFQFELLNTFCRQNGLKLTVSVSNDLSESFDGLTDGSYDLVAKNIVSEYIDDENVDFTEPVLQAGMVLVQKIKPKATFFYETSELSVVAKNMSTLDGKTIHVPRNSMFGNYLLFVAEEAGIQLNIVHDSLKSIEQLIAMVATGEIDYTVCNEKTGKAVKQHYSKLDFSTQLSYDHEFSWAVGKHSVGLKEYLNEWIIQFKDTREYTQIYDRYFSGKPNKYFNRGEYNSFLGGKISEYDKLVQDVSNRYSWDWRLIASIIYQESKFDPNAESGKGATGLMQLMPNTAQFYNVTDMNEPGENIRGGIEYLTWLDGIFSAIIIDDNERIKFILAAYNVGIGHVMDARKLAMKYDHNPSVWNENVDKFLLKKSSPKYYNDPVVRWGYCRGEESTHFVSIVLERYGHYVNVLPSSGNSQIAEFRTRK